MEGQEPDSRYLVLWICVIIASSIVVVGWLVSMKYSFNKINAEMNDNVGQDFEQAEQQVLSIFSDVNDAIRKDTQDLEFTDEQMNVLNKVEEKVEAVTKETINEE